MKAIPCLSLDSFWGKRITQKKSCYHLGINWQLVFYLLPELFARVINSNVRKSISPVPCVQSYVWLFADILIKYSTRSSQKRMTVKLSVAKVEFFPRCLLWQCVNFRWVGLVYWWPAFTLGVPKSWGVWETHVWWDQSFVFVTGLQIERWTIPTRILSWISARHLVGIRYHGHRWVSSSKPPGLSSC